MAEDVIYLTVGLDPRGRGLVAIVTMGQPQLGDENVNVLSLEIVKTEAEAKAWFEQVKIDRPWETRN